MWVFAGYAESAPLRTLGIPEAGGTPEAGGVREAGGTLGRHTCIDALARSILG